jgi:hypothetical protein
VTNNRGLTNPAGLSYISTAPPPTPHLLNTLIGYWKLDEASGSRADSVGTNTLTDHNSTAGAAGKINNGANFVSASSQFLSHVDNSDLRVTGEFTFSVWVKLTTQLACSLVSKQKTSGGSAVDYQISYDTTHGFYFGVGTATGFSDVAQVGAPTSNGTWVHLVGWYDSGLAQSCLRLNDTTTFISTTSPALLQSVASFLVGSGDTVAFANALVDEIGFWKRKLNALEITALYNGGAGLPLASFTA